MKKSQSWSLDYSSTTTIQVVRLENDIHEFLRSITKTTDVQVVTNYLICLKAKRQRTHLIEECIYHVT